MLPCATALLILRATELLARIAYYRAALRFPFPFHEQLQNADMNIECIGNRLTHVLIDRRCGYLVYFLLPAGLPGDSGLASIEGQSR